MAETTPPRSLTGRATSSYTKARLVCGTRQVLGRRERPPPSGIRYIKFDLGRGGGNVFTATVFLLGYALYLIGGRGIFGEIARDDTPQEAAFEMAQPGVAYSDQQRKEIAAKTGQPVGVQTAPPVAASPSAQGTNRPARRTGTSLPSKRERSRAVLQTQRKVKGAAVNRVARSKANNRRVKTSALLGQRRAEKKREEAQRRLRKRAAKLKARQALARQKAELARKTKAANARRLRGL